MIFTPKPYQDIALDHMTEHGRCALWAGMGMGKTVSGLNYYNRLVMQGERAPALVLAPKLVAATTWPDEAEKWDHLHRNLRVVNVTGTERQRTRALGKDANVFTTNYENVPWLVDVYKERWPFKTIIADEAPRLKSFRLSGGRQSQRIQVSKKGTKGLRARALGKVAHALTTNFIELTGTPSPNGLEDLWGQLWMLDQGKRLGHTISSFKERWFRPSRTGFGSEPLKHSFSEIQELISDICLTLDAKDWFDIDDPIVVNKYVDLPDNARRLYKQMEKQFYCEVESRGVEAVHSAAKSQKLLQLASGAVYVDPEVDTDEDPRSKEWRQAHDVKLQMLESIMTEASGAPVLVAYHFRSDRERIKKAFPKAVVLTPKNNIEVQKAWNEGRIPLLAAHPASAGHGLNLQYGGNILVNFSHDWNLEYRLQILERIGPVRQKQAGFERPVFIYNIVARDTIDELVLERTDEKKLIQDILLSSMKR